MNDEQRRVLAKARTFDGACRADFAAPNVCDGGKPIVNTPARFYELDKMGYVFEPIGKRHKCKVFRLVSEPDVDVDRASGTPSCPGVPSERLTDSSSAAGPMSTDTLFGMPRVKPAVSPYDPMSDAA